MKKTIRIKIKPWEKSPDSLTAIVVAVSLFAALAFGFTDPFKSVAFSLILFIVMLPSYVEIEEESELGALAKNRGR